MSPTLTSAYLRSSDRSVTRVDAPVTSDLLGTELRYYARRDGVTLTSTSVRALCAQLGAVTLEPLALAESLAFGMVLRDQTVVAEVRSIPPHSTLHPDGSITTHEGPRTTGEITDAAVATSRARDLLESITAELEPRFDVHCVGYTGGRDSRILAALPRATPDRWHWLSVSGRGDAEHEAARRHAERLGLAHFDWMEWTGDFLDDAAHPGRHRVSAELASGIGAASDYTLLRACFEDYREQRLGRAEDDRGVALWIGTHADTLLARTYVEPARTLWEALLPRTAHLPRVLSRSVLERFEAESGYYHSNPYSFSVAHEEERGLLIRMLSRGRSFVCKGLASLDRVCPTQINPYCHPAFVELALSLAPALRSSDAVREGLLSTLGPELSAPSAFGYRAPAYSRHVFDALAAEAIRCAPLDRLIDPPLLEAMRESRFPDLMAGVAPDASASAPVYRTHAEEAPGVTRSLRHYEHLLTYATFLNLLIADGVAVR